LGSFDKNHFENIPITPRKHDRTVREYHREKKTGISRRCTRTNLSACGGSSIFGGLRVSSLQIIWEYLFLVRFANLRIFFIKMGLSPALPHGMGTPTVIERKGGSPPAVPLRGVPSAMILKPFPTPPNFLHPPHRFLWTSGVSLCSAGSEARGGSPPSNIFGTPLPPAIFFFVSGSPPLPSSVRGGLPPFAPVSEGVLRVECQVRMGGNPTPHLIMEGGGLPGKREGVPPGCPDQEHPLPPAGLFVVPDPCSLPFVSGGTTPLTKVVG
jgi:hypothetical protein